MKAVAALTVILTVIGAVGFGAGWAVNDWRAGNGDEAGDIVMEAAQLTEIEASTLGREALIGKAPGLGRESICESLEYDGLAKTWIVRCVCDNCYQGNDIIVTLSVPDPRGEVRVLSCTPSTIGACKIAR